MTVKELKKKLEEFDDDFIILVPNAGWHPYSITPPEIPATSVSRGINELDGYVIIDDYEEDEDDE